MLIFQNKTKANNKISEKGKTQETANLRCVLLQLVEETWKILLCYQIFENTEDIELDIVLFRSNRSQIFYKIGVLKTFTKFTENRTCWILFTDKAANPQPATLTKKITSQKFSCNF